MPDPAPNPPPASPFCQRCRAAIAPAPGFPELCDDCIELHGSCCLEWVEREVGNTASENQ